MKRTLAQNRSLHAMFTEIAYALTEKGLDMKATLRQDVEIPWTARRIKEFLWKPIQYAIYGTDSTTELNTIQLQKVFEVLKKYLGEKGIEVNFPSEDFRNLIK